MIRPWTSPSPPSSSSTAIPPAIRETGRALRSLIFAHRPGHRRDGPARLALDRLLAARGRRVRNFAWIGPERKHIHLGFEHGTLLADPEQLLQGAEERLKKFRYFTFEPAIDVDEAILADYLAPRRRPRDAAVGRAPGPRAPTRAGRRRPDDGPRRLGVAHLDIGANVRGMSSR